MEFMTHIAIPQSEWKIGGSAKILLVGSCFADEIGRKMERGGLNVMVNPFGTLYNPASIAASLLRSISENEYTADSPELLRGLHDGLWHSWMHHSSFSSPSKETLLYAVNATMHKVADFLREADVLIVTLGTAIIYRLRDTGRLVANCHKMPDQMFVRELMSSYDIADQWQMLLQLLGSINPKLKVIFTVSPIRHKRDGYHANQISKGTLLCAVEALSPSLRLSAKQKDEAGADKTSTDKDSSTQGMGEERGSNMPNYFPSYEIMMDELRDYRFHADDMIHPSEKAVEYIWQRFQDTYFDSKTRDTVAKATKEWARRQHRPIAGTGSAD